MNIEHPYKSLVAALKRLDITKKGLLKVAWNFVNDWLRTSLCLQHKPHYIAAGSLFLAAKVMKVKLPTAKGKAWWLEFDVSPKQLEDVIQQMMSLWEQSQSQTLAPKDQNVTESLNKTTATCSTLSGSSIVPDSKTIASKDACEPTKSTTSNSVKQRAFEKVVATSREPPNCQTSDTGSGVSVVEDGEPVTVKSDSISSCKIVLVRGIVGNSQVDLDRIREKLKKRSYIKAFKKSRVEEDMDGEIDGEALNRTRVGEWHSVGIFTTREAKEDLKFWYYCFRHFVSTEKHRFNSCTIILQANIYQFLLEIQFYRYGATQYLFLTSL